MGDSPGPTTGVVWFRRDLRLANNPAWAHATAACDRVVPLFVLDDPLLRSGTALRRNLLFGHLEALDRELRDLGGHLIVREGKPRDVVPAVMAECGATALFHHSEFSSYALRRDATVAAAAPGETFVSHGGMVHPPGSVLTAKGTLSQVFSPFHREWERTPTSVWPEAGDAELVTMATVPVPSPKQAPVMAPGTDGAWERLVSWLERVDDYQDHRDLPAVDGTSGLSTDLRFGTIAARTLRDVIGDTTPGRAGFVRQLAWRDWYAHTLAERPNLATAAVRPEFDRIRWREDDDAFARWCDGRTGYPIVDAGMRQLVATGWMHNRLRMICASFLVKDLLIDWRRGEAFFRRHLIDADVAQNAGNWQWVAGTGPDAAPYSRIFNPTTQSKKFDGDGRFIRRWVPELASLDTKQIHEPWLVGPLDLATAGVVLGDTYPEPIVDHSMARERTLEAYSVARG